MNETQLPNQKVLETVNICSNEEKGNFQLTSQKTEMVKLMGITTSQINQALKANNPYPARVFLKLDCIECHNTKQICQALSPKHKKCEECAEKKCKRCEIPVFFRIKENGNWIKPKLKKGTLIEIQGNFANSSESQRKSFTAYSYQLIERRFF